MNEGLTFLVSFVCVMGGAAGFVYGVTYLVKSQFWKVGRKDDDKDR